jgi:hypothetical protein
MISKLNVEVEKLHKKLKKKKNVLTVPKINPVTRLVLSR